LAEPGHWFILFYTNSGVGSEYGVNVWEREFINITYVINNNEICLSFEYVNC